MLVRFNNVGRQSTCWDAELPDMNLSTILREVKRKVRFASRYVEVKYDAERNIGEVLVGWRTVGNFSVVRA